MSNQAIAKADEFSFQDIRQRLKAVLEENKSACVRINGRLEITRPVALALLNQLSRWTASLGGNLSVSKEVLSISPAVVKSKITIDLPNKAQLHFEALGASEETDITGEKRILHDSLSTAETRSIKRLLEETLGEDFINQVLAPFSSEEVKASKKQVDLITKLVSEKKLSLQKVSKAVVGKEIKTKNQLTKLTQTEASKLINYLLQGGYQK